MTTEPAPPPSVDPRRAYPSPKEVAAHKAAAQRPPGGEKEMAAQVGVSPDFGLASYRGKGSLAGKRAVITGADSGIGRAVALAFAREGCASLVLACLGERGDLAATVAAIEEQGGPSPGQRGTTKVATVVGDLADEGVRRAVVEAATGTFAEGKIDILIANAAFQGEAVEKLEDIPFQRAEKTFAVNVVAPLRLLQLALPSMGPGSSVVFTSSIEASSPEATIADYAASKAALSSLVKSLAPELASKHGIRLNAVNPGPVLTPLVVASFPEDKLESFGGNYPMGRASMPAEQAGAFVFLCQDSSTYVTGAEIAVTGGAAL